MQKYNNLLFDLDGTLTDSAPGILNCVRYALSEMNFPEPPDIMRFVGPPLCESFPDFCGMDDEQTKEAIRLYRSRYSTVGLLENTVYDGIPEMLERLKKGGRRLFVATSKPEVFSVRILDKFGLFDYFELIGGAATDGTRDTKHDVIRYLLDKADIHDTSDVLMIGDRKHDIIGAHSLGIRCMAVLWGYGSTDEFNEHGADYIISEPSDLADTLLLH